MNLKAIGFCVVLFFVTSWFYGQETYRDEFNLNLYSLNEGSQNFAAEWQELGETTDPDNGQIQISANRLRFTALTGRIILRNLNLDTATSATITFTYDGSGIGDEVLSLILRRDNGDLVILQNYGNGVGTATFDFPPEYIHANSAIGFYGIGWDPGEAAFVDNVQVSATFPGDLSIEDVTVNEDDGTALFTVTHVGPNTSGPFTVNFQTNNGIAIAGEDYTAIPAGTLNFNGTQGDSDTFLVSIIDDAVTETPSENFTISFTATSDPTVDITGIGTGTIIDNEIILEDVPLTLYDQLSGNFDYAVAGGTLRTQSNDIDPCAITTNSSGALTSTVLPGATVKRAYLYWAHSNFILDDTVNFEGVDITADIIYRAPFVLDGGQNINFYGYIADVTTEIESLTNPFTNTYDFTGLNIDNGGDFCESATVLGAWSLMIFYEEPSLSAATINLYYGFDLSQNQDTSFTLDNFYAISPTGSSATFLSYEGDFTLDGSSGDPGTSETLSITNQVPQTFLLTGDGGQTGNNAYNSTIFNGLSGVNQSDIYGLDLDTYDISTFISNLDTQVTANINVARDLILSAAVVLRVPSNLISGTIFEDINYGGGVGRNLNDANGVGIANARVEIYDDTNTFWDFTTTDENGDYSFGGMPDGTYSIRVVNSSVRSTRGGGATCTDCHPIQTFRNNYNGTTVIPITDEIGGAIPSASSDANSGTLVNALTISTITVANGGIGGIDFGFNFNTIVNTNEDGQGSLDQFIVNSNNLDETGLDIEANSIFDPAVGEDTTVFMIPPTGDALGRTADGNFVNGYFNISVPNGNPFTPITANNTKIDGRTQTAYSGNTNTGTVSTGVLNVGVSANNLPNYDRPEIQLYRGGGDVLRVDANNTTIRNIAVYSNNNAGILINDGSVSILNNLLGVNALGASVGNIDSGIEITGGDVIVDENYIFDNTDQGIWIRDANSVLIQSNTISTNGDAACNDNILIDGGSNIIIQRNLIDNAASFGIDFDGVSGSVTVIENTITNSGQNGGNCGGVVRNAGINVTGVNSSVTNNIITANGGAGILITGASSTGNLISQNSIFANGTAGAALGIDINADGVTLNDIGDADTGANGSENFPVIAAVNLTASELVVRGWAAPGTTLEFFFTDINEGTATIGDNQLGLTKDYGEGQVFIGSAIEGSIEDLDTSSSSYSDVDGNEDNTNKFKFTFPLPSGTTLGDSMTATGTRSNSTSEFSPSIEVKAYTVITNSRITYRVKTNN